MTGRSKSGRMSMRVRSNAGAEQSTNARTITITVMGLLNAARISHMVRDLPAPSGAETGRTAGDLLGLRSKMPGHSKQPGGQVRHRFPPVPIGLAPPPPLRYLPVRLCSARLPASQRLAPREVR